MGFTAAVGNHVLLLVNQAHNKPMTNPTPIPNPNAQSADKKDALPSPLKCLSGALISGGIGLALYFLTSSIAHTFADKPLASTNATAVNIAIAVRTLVVGVSTLATFVFSFIAVGLVAVAIVVTAQQLKKSTAPPSDVK
jgi:hypothetical protein